MTDLISRADAIEAVRKKLQDWGSYAFEDYRRGLYEAQDIIEALPSAEAVHKPDYSCEADMVRRLKESLSADGKWIPKEHFDVLKKNYDMLAGLLEEAKARAIGAWIPCSKRLPSNDECVLVSVDYGIEIEFGKYENGEWSIWDCEHWDKWGSKGVIAWMPLPTPYKGGDDE